MKIVHESQDSVEVRFDSLPIGATFQSKAEGDMIWMRIGLEASDAVDLSDGLVGSFCEADPVTPVNAHVVVES